MFAGAIAGSKLPWTAVAHVLLWASLGNAIGGLMFAAIIRQGVRMHHDGQDDRGADREEGREQRRRGGV